MKSFILFFFNDTATTEIYTLSLHDALPIYREPHADRPALRTDRRGDRAPGKIRPDRRSRVAGHHQARSEEHTSELQSLTNLVCRLLLEKKNTQRLGSPSCSI